MSEQRIYRDEAGHRIYGLMAEFDTSQHLLQAVDQVRAAGYQKVDAYTPFPVEGLPEALGVRGVRLPLIVLGGGIIGALVGYGMQYYAMAIDYPLNVGGRPLHSWPMYIPITFELTILFAAFAAVLGMFALNGLPQPYHPVFNAPNFEMASRSHFFLVIESDDPEFDLDETAQLLESTGADQVATIPYQ